VKVHPGETYILCTDGLCGFADDGEIFAVAKEYRNDLPKLVENLVQMANDRGGSDNVTVAALQVLEASVSPLPELGPLTLISEPNASLAGEDRWVQKLAEVIEREPSPRPKVGKPNRMLLIGLFVAFAVIAVLIVYLARPQ
jgi:hypothetical protein